MDTNYNNALTERLKKKTKDYIRVMQAFIDGKDIEYRYDLSSDIWIDCACPFWNWDECDYRIKESQPTIQEDQLHPNEIDRMFFVMEKRIGELEVEIADLKSKLPKLPIYEPFVPYSSCPTITPPNTPWYSISKVDGKPTYTVHTYHTTSSTLD